MDENWEESLNEQDWGQDWESLRPPVKTERILDLNELADEQRRISTEKAVETREAILLKAHWGRLNRAEVVRLVSDALERGYSWKIDEIATLWPENYTDQPIWYWPESLLIGTEKIDSLGIDQMPKTDAVWYLLSTAHHEKFGRTLVEFGFKRIFGEKLGPGAWVVVQTWPEIYGKS